MEIKKKNQYGETRLMQTPEGTHKFRVCIIWELSE